MNNTLRLVTYTRPEDPTAAAIWDEIDVREQELRDDVAVLEKRLGVHVLGHAARVLEEHLEYPRQGRVWRAYWGYVDFVNSLSVSAFAAIRRDRSYVGTPVETKVQLKDWVHQPLYSTVDIETKTP